MSSSSPRLDAAPKAPKEKAPKVPKVPKEKTEKPASEEKTADATAAAAPTKTKGSHNHSPMLQFDDPKKVAKFNKSSMVVRTQVQKIVPLFSHLPQYEREQSLSLKLKVGFSSEEIHPAILRLGLQYAAGTISGGNARCVAMLTALKQYIEDYTTPPSKLLRDDLLSKLKPIIRFLKDCRPHSNGMGNAIRYLKMNISKIKPHIPEAKAKEMIIASIHSFIQERIEFADEVIASHGASKINDGETVLTHASSHVVEMIFKRAYDEGKKFRVIIVDSRPKMEGKELLRRLTDYGLKCTYIGVNAISYVMSEVSKVFIGASVLLSNGSVISRVGSALVALNAHMHHVPFLVCCETYKFHEKVLLDSICFNELGDPDDLLQLDRNDEKSDLCEWRDLPNLKLLNLVYDITPVQCVSMVITEVGMIPPTSVPVILREYNKDDVAEVE